MTSNNSSLYIQSDGPDPEGWYHRSRSMPLAMGTTSIPHFTNWNNKINSLGGGNAPWYAQAGDWSDRDVGNPTDVEIIDDIAVVSYGNHNNLYEMEADGSELYAHVVVTEENNYSTSAYSDWQNVALAFTPPAELKAALRSQTIYNKYGTSPLNPSNCYFDNVYVEITLSGYVGNDFFAGYAGKKIRLSYDFDRHNKNVAHGILARDPDDGCPSFLKVTDTNFVAGTIGEGRWVYAMGASHDFGFNSPEHFICGNRGDLGGIYDFMACRGPDFLDEVVHASNGKYLGLNIYKAWQDAYGGDSPTPTDLNQRIGQFNGGQGCSGGETLDPDDIENWTRPLHGKLPIGVLSIKVLKDITFTGSGKVEIYQRKRGFISAIIENSGTPTNEVTIEGIGDSNLFHGDIIKISSALSSTSRTSPMNGIKYIKEGGDKNVFLYDDEDFFHPTDTSDVRTTDGITWANYGNKDGGNPAQAGSGTTWELLHTLNSPLGSAYVQETGEQDGQPQGPAPGWIGKCFNGYAMNDDKWWIHEDRNFYSSFNFGCDTDIKKWKTEDNIDYYLMIVGERGHAANMIDRGRSDNTLGQPMQAYAEAPSHLVGSQGDGGFSDGDEGPVPDDDDGFPGDDADDGDSGGYSFESNVTYQAGRARPLPNFLPHGRAHIYVITKDRYGTVTSLTHTKSIDASTNDPLINHPEYLLEWNPDPGGYSGNNPIWGASDPTWGLEAAPSWFQDYQFLDPRNLYWFKAAMTSLLLQPSDFGTGIESKSVAWHESDPQDGYSGLKPADNKRWSATPAYLKGNITLTFKAEYGDFMQNYIGWFRLKNNTHLYLYEADVLEEIGDDVLSKYSFAAMATQYGFVDSFGKSVAIDIIDGQPMYCAASNVKTHMASINQQTTAEIQLFRNYYTAADGTAVNESNVEFLDQLLTPSDSDLLVKASVGYIHTFGEKTDAENTYTLPIKLDRISNQLDKHLPLGSFFDIRFAGRFRAQGNYSGNTPHWGATGVTWENYDETGNLVTYTDDPHDRLAGRMILPLINKVNSWCNSLSVKNGKLIYGQPTVTFMGFGKDNMDFVAADYNTRIGYTKVHVFSKDGDRHDAPYVASTYVKRAHVDSDSSSLYIYELRSDKVISAGTDETWHRPYCRSCSSYCPWLMNVDPESDEGHTGRAAGATREWCFHDMVRVYAGNGEYASRYAMDNEIQHAFETRVGNYADGVGRILEGTIGGNLCWPHLYGPGCEPGTIWQGRLGNRSKNTFGYHVKYDKDVILTNALSFYNTVDNPIQLDRDRREPNAQNYIFVIKRGKHGFAKAMRIAPAEANGAGFPIGDITYSNSLDNSYTKDIALINRYDTFDNKIIMGDGIGYAVFDLNTVPEKLNIETGTQKAPLEHYFIFNEVMRGNSPQPGSVNYDLANVYKSNFDISRGFGESLRLKTNNDGNNAYMYFFKVPIVNPESDLRILESIDIEFEVDNISAFREGQDVDVSKDSLEYLPAVGIYRGDIRETIRQLGYVGGTALEFGLTSSGIDRGKLYEGGILDEWNDSGELGTGLGIGEFDYDKIVAAAAVKSSTIKTPTYVDNSIINPTFTGTVSLGKEDLAKYVDYNDLTKSSYTRKIYNNKDGTGDTSLAGSLPQFQYYLWALNDASKEAYDSSVSNIQATIAISFGNRMAFDDSDSAYKGSLGNAFDNGDTYFVENEVDIKSVTLTYSDQDFSKIRPVLCSFFAKHNVLSEPDSSYVSQSDFANPIIRLGRSQTAAYFDQDDDVLVGAFSNSIQVLHVTQDSSDGGTIRNIDIHQPEALSLHMISFPSDSRFMPLSTRGTFPTSSETTLVTGGIHGDSDVMPLRMGPPQADSSMPLVMPEVFGTSTQTMPLYTPTAKGTDVDENTSLYLGPGPGVEAIANTFPLYIGMPTATGSMPLYILGGIASGLMPLSIPSAYEIHNSLACVNPHLFTEGSIKHSKIGSLVIGKPAINVTRPLYMRSPEPFSDNTTLMVASILSDTMPLHTSAVGDTSGNQILFIGQKVTEQSMPLVFNYEVASSQMPLFTTSTTTQSNSLDDNFGASCVVKRRDTIFDRTNIAERPIVGTLTNSVSRDKLLRNLPNVKSLDYGLQRNINIGSTITNYGSHMSAKFYRNELSRESFDANGAYFAVGINADTDIGIADDTRSLQIFEILSGDQVNLIETYDDLVGDIYAYVVPDIDINKMCFKSVKISPQNRIAVAMRLEGTDLNTQAISFQDAIVILHLVDNEWTSVTAFVSRVTPDENAIPDMDMGTSLEWDNEALYYNKQTSTFGEVYYRDYSDDFASESKVVEFEDTVDFNGYQRNAHLMELDTKVAFGYKIKIYDNLMFVAAPLLDPYIASKTLDRFEAASFRGAVYIFTRSGEVWSYANAVYVGGYTSANISDQFECGYDANLFGYDFDYDSDTKLLIVGEPISRKVHRFNVGLAGTPSLIETYTGTSAQVNFGAFVSLCNKTNPITSSRRNAGTIHNLYSGVDFNFGSTNTINEVIPYVPSQQTLHSSSETVVSIRSLQFASGKKLLVVRDFIYNYGVDTDSSLQKLTLMDESKFGSPLYIAGPLEDANNISLVMVRPSGGATDTLGISLPVVGITGSLPLFMQNNPQSGLIPLHMRVEEKLQFPLFMQTEFTDQSRSADLYLQTMTGISTAANLSLPVPHKDDSQDTSLFQLGGLGPAVIAPLFIDEGTRAPITIDSGKSIIIGGSDVAGITGFNDVYISGGDSGPDYLTFPLVMKAPPSATVTDERPLYIDTLPASGIWSNTNSLYLTNTQTSVPADSVGASIVTDTMGLLVHSPGTGVVNIPLTLFRKGIGGGEEYEGSRSLIVFNQGVASNISMYTSGNFMSSESMNLKIGPPWEGGSSGNPPLMVRGYTT